MKQGFSSREVKGGPYVEKIMAACDLGASDIRGAFLCPGEKIDETDPDWSHEDHIPSYHGCR
jgi:hypothetical protein